ncbi:PD-(D/E)XK nuclease family protein [Streptosporangiaceae bacterium NEAU-GS5]|nr:PD-(D/E)XK nuclease family protein [Streptosporangiaceae bacterium NEAU-GS5]
MEQLGLDVAPRRLYTCTPSRLNAWLECPRRYRFAYLDRPAPPKGPPWAHNSMGASVHNALAGWWREPYERRTPLLAAVLLTNGWISEGYRDQEQSELWRDRARTMVSGYAATLDPADEPVGVERTVATRTRVLAVSGRIDRLDRRGDELVVVDYKTGRRPLTTDDARGSLALAIYAIASSRMMHRPCHKVELHHLPTGEIVEWEHTDASLGRHLARAEEIAQEASAADEAYKAWRATGPPPARPAGTPSPGADVTAQAGAAEVPEEIDRAFAPLPGAICSWCDYRRHCPEGRAAAPDRSPWDGLATTDTYVVQPVSPT